MTKRVPLLFKPSRLIKVVSTLIWASLLICTSFADPTSPPSSVSQPTRVIAHHETDEANQPAERIWNLQDADILSVINEVSQETGKSFVVDSRVNGKITLVSTKPIRRDQVYQVFLSVLGLLGYSAIPSGDVVKIVPNMESGELATRVASVYAKGKGDEVVVRVIPLQNISATQILPVLRPLLPQWSNISAYTPGNVLLLLGRADNIERIYRIIQDVDKSTHNGIEIIPLHHASAGQITNVLNNLQAASRTSGDAPTVSIAPDDRSNSILLSGPQALRLKMRVLIAQLDNPDASGEGNTEVIYLRYLEARTLAPLLGRIAANILGKGEGLNSTASAETSSSSSSGSSNGSANSSSANTKAVAPANMTNIQAEPNTNAIVITAPPALMRAIKRVIAKLDIRPKEVLVEAIIAEVDESNLNSLGIQWGSLGSDGTLQPLVTQASGSFGTGIFGIIPGAPIEAVLTALSNTNGVDILSTPEVVVLDNQKASIEVGKDVPEQTGSYSTTGTTGTVTPFNTIGRLKVTLRLDVTPQINLGSAVKMKIMVRNDTLQNPDNPGLNPTINTSRITNSVIINSSDVLVLGGLVSSSTNENILKVPIVSSIPIIGTLFQQKTRKQEKKKLMVFIKPSIMRESEDAMAISYSKYTQTRSQLANYRDDLRDIDKGYLPPNNLPPWRNQKELPSPFPSEQ